MTVHAVCVFYNQVPNPTEPVATDLDHHSTRRRIELCHMYVPTNVLFVGRLYDFIFLDTAKIEIAEL